MFCINKSRAIIYYRSIMCGFQEFMWFLLSLGNCTKCREAGSEDDDTMSDTHVGTFFTRLLFILCSALQPRSSCLLVSGMW